MKDKDKTKAQLIKELEDLRRQIIELKESEIRHKQAEEVLQTGEEKYRSLFEGSRDAIYVTSREGKFIDANQATFELFGYTRDEMIGMNVIETYVNPADRVRFQLAIEQKGYVRDYEVKFRKKNGTEMDCLLTAALRLADDGNILGYQGIIRDVTEHKRIEEALKKEKEFVENLIQTAQVIVLVLDTKGRIVQFNPYMENISGYHLNEVQGKDWFDTFLLEVDRKRIRELFSKATDDIKTKGNVNPIVTKDGRERKIEWFDKTLKDSNGQTIGLLAIGQDITERKQARAEREKLICELQETLAKVKTLSKLLPICASCKKIRDDKGYWNQIEEYISEHTDTLFSHGVCPDCLKKMYSDFDKEDK